MPAPCKILKYQHLIIYQLFRIPHDNFTVEDPNQVFHMLMKNFNRTYRGDFDDFGGFQKGNRAPWGLYMHAAWFFGQPWHFEGYKMFIAVQNSFLIITPHHILTGDHQLP